jgi:hypothetical protein
MPLILKGETKMANYRIRTKNKASTRKGKKQSPKQAIIKISQALAKAVQKYKLPIQFQKYIAGELLNLLEEVEAQAGTILGDCTVTYDGKTKTFPSSKAFCDLCGGVFVPY